jgi:hypothetical protein
MFEWLDAEIAAIRTRRFHRVDGPASASARRTVAETAGLLPPAYVEVARRYGRASLYRMPRLDLSHGSASWPRPSKPSRGRGTP